MIKYLLTTALFIVSVGCGFVSPDAGQEAVLIKRPILFGHGGVDPEPVTTGLTFTALTTSSIIVEVRPVQFQLHFEDAMTKDGVPVAVLKYKGFEFKLLEGIIKDNPDFVDEEEAA